MEKPVISIISSAIKVQYWMEFYTSINNTPDPNTPSYPGAPKYDIPFEFVFVGNVRPSFALPENFHFIYSEAKPIQCFEIACRNAKGDYVMTAMDDLMFSPGFLPVMYSYMRRMWNDKAIIMSRFSDYMEGPPRELLMYFALDNPLSPVIGVCTIIKKSVWEELGGYDRRFNDIYADNDLHLRIYQAGGYPFITPTAVVRERPHATQEERLVYRGCPDRVLLDSLWRNPDGSMRRTRVDAVQPFSPEEIPIVR